MAKHLRAGKRVLSLFLAALLVITMLPTSLLTALAGTATDTDAAVTAEADADTADDAQDESSDDDGAASEDETTTTEDETSDNSEASETATSGSGTADDVTIGDFASASTGYVTLSGDFCLVYTFTNISNGEDTWDNYVLETNNADGIYLDVRADNYGWTYYPEDLENTASLTFGDDVDDWDSWEESMCEGCECTVTVRKVDGHISVTKTAAGSTLTAYAYLPEYADGDLNIYLIGEECTISNISWTWEAIDTGLIADISFADEDSLSGGGAVATAVGDGMTYGTTDDGEGYVTMEDGASYFTVANEDGSELLAGLTETTISFDAYINGDLSWAYHVTSEDDHGTYGEHYIGIQLSALMMERYNNSTTDEDGNVIAMDRPDCIAADAYIGEWVHYDCVYYADGSMAMFVNGVQTHYVAQTDGYDLTLANCIGSDSTFYVGYANWNDGEYFDGSLKNMKVYSTAIYDANTTLPSSTSTADWLCNSYELGDVDVSYWTSNYSQAIEVTEEGTYVTFHSDSLNYPDDAVYNWNTPVIYAFTANEVFVGGDAIYDVDGYDEYAVIRSDAYGWNSNDWDFWYECSFPDGWEESDDIDALWAEWLAACVEGVDCSLHAWLEDDWLIVELYVNGVTTTMYAQVDTSCPVYISLTGEYCTLTNIYVESYFTSVADVSEEYFPDENFRNYISENIDTNGDGVLSTGEVSRTTSMDVSWRDISDMTGLSYFTNLTYLDVSYNYLTELDVTALTNLITLVCDSNPYGNSITSIDLSQNTKLEYLSMAYYDGTEESPHGLLTELDVSGLSSLWFLEFAWQSVTSLNLSGCTSLTHLGFGGNYLTELDVTDCTALEELYAGENDLEALDVSQNENLRVLIVYSSALTELDLSNNTALTELNVGDNCLTELDLTNNTELTYIDCCDNAITSLDVSTLSNLTELYCAGNALTALDCSGLSNLVNLSCRENQIADLNVTGCYALEYLENGSGCVSEIDLSDCVNLVTMSLGTNALTSIDLSNNTKLQYLYLDTNPDLTEVDLSMLTELQYLDIYNTGITSLDVSNLSGSLWHLNASNNGSLTRIDAQGNALTELDVSSCGALTYLDVSYNNLEYVYLNDCTALSELHVNNNRLTSLCLNGLSELTQDMVWCYDNYYLITVTSEDGSWYLYDINFGDTGINPGAISNLSGATQDEDDYWLLYIDEDADTVTYTYDTENENGIYLDFALTVEVGVVEISEENFPDENFRNYIYELDQNGNGWLSESEIADVTYMDISWRGISDMTGLSYFTNLEYLDVSYNNICDIDVTALTNLRTLICDSNDDGNFISSIDLSQNTALEYLEMNGNQLTDLDLSANTQLVTLWLEYNQLTSLDLSANTLLENVFLCGNSDLTSLNVSTATGLRALDANGCSLVDLDLSNNTDLVSLCLGTADGTETFDFSNLTKLEYLYISGEGFTSLDLSQNTALIELAAGNNNLTELDLSNNTALQYLDLGYNQLTELDVTNNPELTYLNVDANQLTSLDISNNTALTEVHAGVNQLTEVNLSGCSQITYLNIGTNELGAVDLSSLTELETLYVDNNNLTEIDLSSNTKLILLHIYSNQLTTLDVSSLTELTCLNAGSNQLTELDVTNNTALRELYADNTQLTSLDLSACTELEYLYVPYNNLTSLDVSGLTALYYLDAGANALTSLNVDGCTALETLWVDTNELSELDLSTNTALRELWVSNNNLVTLDATACTELEYAWVYNNPLVSFDMSGCYNLYDLNSENLIYYISADEIVDGVYDLSTLVNEYGLDLGRTISDVVAAVETTETGEEDSESEDSPITITSQPEDMTVTAGNKVTFTIEAEGNELSYTWYYLKTTSSSWGSWPQDTNALTVTSNSTWEGMQVYCLITDADGNTLQSNTITITLASEDEEEESEIYLWDGGQVDTGALTLTFDEGSTSASYNYDCGIGWSIYVTITIGVVEINEENFPDENFRYYVSEVFDWNGDGTLSQSEIEGATSIDATWFDIYDLTGIEYLTELTYLNVGGNPISVLDLTANTKLEEVYCNDNAYYWDGTMTVDVSGLTNLWTLEVSCSNVTELNVSGCSALLYISCGDNQMTELDISGLESLLDIWAQNSGLTAMNASGCTSLFMLDCYDNQLTSLNVSGCTALEILSAWNNQLTAVDLSDCTALTELNINDNALVSIDLSNNTELISVNVGNNDLSVLDVSMLSNLNYLYCYGNSLTSIDVTNLYNLTDLNVDDNHITIAASDLSVDEDGNEYIDLSTLEAYGLDLSRISGIWCETDGWIDYDWESIVYIYDNAGCIAYTYHCGDCDNNVNGDDYYRDFRIYITVTIDFDLNYDTEDTVDSITVARNCSAYDWNEIASPEREHYSFTGWYTAAEDEADGFNFDYVTESTTVYAHWDIDTYPVSYDYNYSDGEDLDYTDYIDWNETAVEPETPAREGYDFCGWYDRSTSQAYDFSTPVTGDVSLYARWTLKTSTVTFDANGGSLASDDAASQSVKYGATATEPVTPTCTGYIFAGWFTGTGDDAEEYDFSQAVTEDITLYAHWTMKTWTVSFDANYSGAADIADQTVANGATAEEPTAITRVGYTYIWCEYGTTTEYDFSTQVTGNVELYAKWTRTNHTVTFDANGGELNDSETVSVKHNAAIAEPADPTRTGYIFAGWYTEDGEAYDFDTLVTSSLTLTAKWTVKTYAVTWDTNGGTMNVDGESVTYITDTAKWGRTIEEPEEDPTRTGYTFTGWYVVGTVDLYDFDTLVTGEVHLYAGWSRNTYTVTFNPNGGTSAPDAQTVKYGSRATEPTDPVYSGYTFDGWYTEDGELFDFDTTLITEDITLYAQWTSEGGEVEVPIVITSQPTDTKFVSGEKVTLTITAEGNGLSYTWYYLKEGTTTWKSWPQDTNALSVTANSTWEGMQVYCIVTDEDGNTLQSDIITLTESTDEDTDAIIITAQPVDVEVAAGEKATFTITAEGNDLSYTWYYQKSGSSTWGSWPQNTNALSVTANSTWEGMQVYCLITDADGNTLKSDVVTVTLKTEEEEPADAITITVQPEDMTVTAGTKVTFTVTAEGNDLSYKWYYKKAGATEYSSWSQDTNALRVTANSTWEGMQVYCEITDADGNVVTTNVITVTVAE